MRVVKKKVEEVRMPRTPNNMFLARGDGTKKRGRAGKHCWKSLEQAVFEGNAMAAWETLRCGWAEIWRKPTNKIESSCTGEKVKRRGKTSKKKENMPSAETAKRPQKEHLQM